MSRLPVLAVVAGSGLALDGLLDATTERVPFAGVTGLGPARVSGHAGSFVRGRCGALEVVMQSGRLHLYEGLPLESVVRTVDVLAEWGVQGVVFTNAAGGLVPSMAPGDLLAVKHVELWPCQRWPGAPASLVPDAVLEGCAFRGVYCWVHGPAYETRAEIAALRASGASAVGMSTAPELWQCHERGLRTAVISCITNNCCVRQVLTHEHVVETARAASAQLVRVLRAVLPAFAEACGA